MGKVTQSLGTIVLFVLFFGGCLGMGAQRHLQKGNALNPLDVGWGLGVEGQRVSGNILRIYFGDMFELEGEESPVPTDADYQAQPDVRQMEPAQGGGWQDLIRNPPWRRQPITPQDINADGKVDQTDVELYRQFNYSPAPLDGMPAESN